MRKPLLFLTFLCLPVAAQNSASFRFAVSGDSRNCGDIVMSAIAAGVLENQAQFYWHLGDFRAIYTFDEDLVPPATLRLTTKPLNIIEYETGAWPDFIAHQLAPFGTLPVFLSPGNHETIPPSTRDAYLQQFADWLATPAIRAQRLRDDPADHLLRTYYHWIDHGIDFIALDNASRDQFDAAQLKWVHAVIARDESDSEVRAIVVGMHAALPGSAGFAHSMSDSPQGEQSGRDLYRALLHAQEVSKKHVYVLASHSHFYMEDVYRTDVWKGHVLPGWIVGTAGAVRYRLPAGTTPGPKAMTDVYGYLTGAAAEDGTIDFTFHRLDYEEILRRDEGRHPEALIRWCYDHNKQ